MPNLADKLTLWQQHNRKAIPGALVLALGYTFAINVFRDYQFSIQQLLPRLLLVFVLLVYAPRALSRRRLVPFGVLGALSAFFIVAMRTVVTPEGAPYPWTMGLILPFLLFALTYTLCFCGASVLLDRVDLRASAPLVPLKREWLLLTLALLAFWMPLFLAYGPVRISADSYVVISQALGVNYYDDSHPILYTFLVSVFLRLGQALGSITVGAYLFGFVQMMFFTAVLTYSIHWIHKNGCPGILCLVAFCFFSLSPVFALNGFTMWKDIPFNACLLLLVLALCPIADTRGEWLRDNKHMAAFLGLATAICFLRGNGFPLVAVTFVAIALAFRRHWKRFAACFGGLLVLIAVIQGPVYAAFGLTRLGAVESAGMPIQQVSRAIVNGAELTNEQQEIIERFVPLETIKENYRSASPDYIKKHATFDTPAFNENVGDFMRVWAQLAPANLGEYVNAWLLQTLGYWKFDFGGRTAHFEDDHNGAFGIEYKDFVHRLTGFNLRQFAQDRSAFFPLGLMALMVLFACAYLVACGRTRRALCFVPLLTVWLGLMVGAPTYCDFRYMLVFALALPAVFYITLSKPASEEVAT